MSMIFAYLEISLKEDIFVQCYRHDDGCLEDHNRDTVAQKQVLSTV